MKANDIKEVSEITLYYGGRREEKRIIAGYINIDKPLLFGKEIKHYIVKIFYSNDSFWSLINEEKMEKEMKNCICIRKACYKIDTDRMERITLNLKKTHKVVELNLFE